jgi:hypothetical protein
MRRTRSLLMVAMLVASSLTALLIGQPAIANMPTTHTQSTVADYKYQFDTSGWNCGGANPSPKCKSYIEWWYFKIGEIDGMTPNAWDKVSENYFITIMVVNPFFDDQADGESNGEPSTGVYVALGIMVGETRRTFIEKHDLELFSHGTGETDVWMCPDGQANCAKSASHNYIETDSTTNASKVKTTVKIEIDTDQGALVESSARHRVQTYELPYEYGDEDKVEFELNFERDTTVSPPDVGLNAGNIFQSGTSINPFVDAVVW